VANYIFPVFIFSVLFNIPKFFEVNFIVRSEQNATTGVFNNRTLASPTELRLEKYYVLFYVNAARLLVQGIIPFILLSFFNYRIYWVIRSVSNVIIRLQSHVMCSLLPMAKAKAMPRQYVCKQGGLHHRLPAR
jgi:hypothetical protein